MPDCEKQIIVIKGSEDMSSIIRIYSILIMINYYYYIYIHIYYNLSIFDYIILYFKISCGFNSVQWGLQKTLH